MSCVLCSLAQTVSEIVAECGGVVWVVIRGRGQLQAGTGVAAKQINGSKST